MIANIRFAVTTAVTADPPAGWAGAGTKSADAHPSSPLQTRLAAAERPAGEARLGS